MKKFFLNKKGFTLVELVVTIALIAVLTSTAVTLGRGIVDSQKDKTYSNYAETCYNTCQTFMSELNNGISIYSNQIATTNQFSKRFDMKVVNIIVITENAPKSTASTGLYINYKYEYDEVQKKTMHKVKELWYIPGNEKVYHIDSTGNNIYS